MSNRRPTPAEIDREIAYLADPVHLHPVFNDEQRKLAIAILRKAQEMDDRRRPSAD